MRTRWIALALVLVLVTVGAVLVMFATAAPPAAPTGPAEPSGPWVLAPVDFEPEPPTPATVQLVAYQGPVEHIFFHPLIIYPELAFDGDSMARGYNDWFVTIPEFNKMIDALYQRNFILVDFRVLFEVRTENGKATLVRKELMLPPGKKPLIISIDDLNYYDYMRLNGNAWRLVLDDQGRVATESFTPKGERVIGYDNEIIPLLDSFVAAHPDFSLNGAKGVIALTGYQGVLGYRTNTPGSPTYAQEKADALKVIERLKETGWTFASHGWGHLDAAKISYATFVRDTDRWKAEVEPLIGPTDVYIYPFGSAVTPSDPKFQYLLQSGFRIMNAVGPAPYLKATSAYAMMDRRHIDGIALHSQRKLLLPFFDADQIIDPVRPAQY